MASPVFTWDVLAIPEIEGSIIAALRRPIWGDVHAELDSGPPRGAAGRVGGVRGTETPILCKTLLDDLLRRAALRQEAEDGVGQTG